MYALTKSYVIFTYMCTLDIVEYEVCKMEALFFYHNGYVCVNQTREM